MRYKTKKYIKKSFLYVFNTSIILLFYIIAAHKLYLPAFFEYYTGETVRKHTAAFYEKYLEITGSESAASVSTQWDYMSMVDLLIREPDYLYINDVLRTMQSDSDTLKPFIPKKIKDDLITISTHPALIEFLKNPKGQYGPVYQYEMGRFIDSMATIHDYAILGNDGKVLFSRGKLTSKDNPSTLENVDLVYKKGLALIVVKHKNKQIGKVLANTGEAIPVNLNFENTGLDVSYFFLANSLPDGGHNGSKIIDKNISNTNLQKWVRGDVFLGPVNGVHDGNRFILKNFDQYNLLIVYKAQNVFFYISKFIIYLILVFFIASLYILIKKGAWRAFFQKKKLSYVDDLLKKSNEITLEYAAISVKFQNALHQVKSQEVDRLRIISEHLGLLHQSIYKSTDHEIHKLKSPD